MPQTTDRPLPLDRDTLDRYWMPPEPDTDVSRLTARHAELDARRAQIAAALAQAHAADVAAIADAPDLDQALVDLDPDTVRVTLMERQAAVLTAAADLVRSRLDHAARTDPDYLAWRAECQTILTDWITAQRVDTADKRDDRRHRMMMFAHRHG